jgi:hypothetical protein
MLWHRNSKDEAVRPAKSGNEWVQNDLASYNIHVHSQTDAKFFGPNKDTCIAHIDPDLVSATKNSEETVSDSTHRILHYLVMTTKSFARDQSALNDFAREMMHIEGYEERGNLLRSGYSIPFTVAGEANLQTQTALALLHRTSTILLLVRVETREGAAHNPEAQIIAGAIAAFQTNNRNRKELGLKELDQMAIPCITMIGTRPIFYVVPVTDRLSEAVATGQFPRHRTEVPKFVVPMPNRKVAEGMEEPQSRKAALEYLHAFNIKARSCYEKLLA